MAGKNIKMKRYLLNLSKFLLKKSFHKGVILGNHTQNGRQIKEEVETLAPFFDFIHHDQLMERMVTKQSKPFCLFTFDDGKKITAEQSALELEKMGIPAVFYLVTDHISNGLPLWFDRRNAIIKTLGYEPDEVKAKKLKKMPMDRITETLNQFCAEYGVEADLTDPHVACMSWEDARSLYKRGFTIGAHTKTHPILTNESPVTAMNEIHASIKTVKKKLGGYCPSFAFPNGNYTAELAKYARSCGVRTVMTTDPLWVQTKTVLHQMPRIDIYNHYDSGKMLFKVSAAIPGCILNNPNGTGRRYAFR